MKVTTTLKDRLDYEVAIKSSGHPIFDVEIWIAGNAIICIKGDELIKAIKNARNV